MLVLFGGTCPRDYPVFLRCVEGRIPVKGKKVGFPGEAGWRYRFHQHSRIGQTGLYLADNVVLEEHLRKFSESRKIPFWGIVTRERFVEMTSRTILFLFVPVSSDSEEKIEPDLEIGGLGNNPEIYVHFCVLSAEELHGYA